ncbi:MAG: tRNA 2-thiouridine(34) synthase MnmA [Myxococcota bacterium]
MERSSYSGPARVLVALSGGVDSSVAAALLVEQGHEVVGVTLHLWDAAGEAMVGRCCSPEDREDARLTCDALGIPHYVLDEREAFRREVVGPFLDAYRAGRTPSPCVHCNRTVKLVHLAALAERFGCDAVATGHYARVRPGPEGVRLLAGVDRDKDQSYFLFGVPGDVLARMRFPLGELTKAQARAEGRRLQVPNADKADSQELCFVPDGDIAGFVQRERGPGRPGRLLSGDGEVLGHHGGVEGFTVGQRRGLGLGGGPARYVLRILGDDVVVGGNDALAGTQLRARDARWVGPRPRGPFEATVRVRHRHRPAPARVTPGDGDRFEVAFLEPQRALTPGQAAVVYRGDQVLGGGFIDA